MSRKSKKPVESVAGSYAALPHVLLDSAAFTGASARAKAMLIDLARQHNGSNNGRLHATASWLAKRGWSSHDGIQRAVAELIERNLVVMTKQGGRNIGPTLYALTWLQITRFDGLDITAKSYWPGAWAGSVPQPLKRHTRRPASRGSTTPPHGAGGSVAAPPHGAKTSIDGDFAAPPHGEDVCIPLPPVSNSSAMAAGGASESKRLACYLAKLAEARMSGGRHAARVRAHLAIFADDGAKPTTTSRRVARKRPRSDAGRLSDTQGHP